MSEAGWLGPELSEGNRPRPKEPATLESRTPSLKNRFHGASKTIFLAYRNLDQSLKKNRENRGEARPDAHEYDGKRIGRMTLDDPFAINRKDHSGNSDQ